jgi:predicted nucleotidyltransferase
VYEYLIAEALKRREVFNNLNSYLQKLKVVILKVDPKAEVYLFGSVAEKKHTYSSDIDILVITEENRLKVLNKIVEEGLANLFEVHIRKPREAGWYKRLTKLVKI